MSSMRPLVKLILSVALLIGAYYLGRGGYYILYHAKEFDKDASDQFERLVPAEAKVTAAERRSTANGHYRAQYVWTVHYEFGPIDGDGKTRAGEFTEDEPRQSAASFGWKAGDPVSIYYDPQTPSFSHTRDWYERNKQNQGRYGVVWMGAAFMGVALLFLIGGGLLLPRAILALLGKTDATKA